MPLTCAPRFVSSVQAHYMQGEVNRDFTKQEKANRSKCDFENRPNGGGGGEILARMQERGRGIQCPGVSDAAQ